MDGAGNVTGLVRLPRPHVDEDDAHSAPRGVTSSRSTS